MKLLNKNKKITVWCRAYTLKTTWKPYIVTTPSYRVPVSYVYNKHIFQYHFSAFSMYVHSTYPKNKVKDLFLYREHYVESKEHEPLELRTPYNKKQKYTKRHTCTLGYVCDRVRCVHTSSPYS
jgi:hypothetical protein